MKFDAPSNCMCLPLPDFPYANTEHADLQQIVGFDREADRNKEPPRAGGGVDSISL